MTEPAGEHRAPVSQVDATPTAKITMSLVAGSAVTVLISVAKSFGYTLEPEVASAIVVLGGFLAGYFKRSRPADIDL